MVPTESRKRLPDGPMAVPTRLAASWKPKFYSTFFKVEQIKASGDYIQRSLFGILAYCLRTVPNKTANAVHNKKKRVRFSKSFVVCTYVFSEDINHANSKAFLFTSLLSSFRLVFGRLGSDSNS